MSSSLQPRGLWYARSSCLDKLRIRDSCSLVLQTALASFFVHWCFRAYFSEHLRQVLGFAAPSAHRLNNKRAERPAQAATSRQTCTNLRILRLACQFSGAHFRQISRRLQRMHHRKIDSQWRIVKSVHKQVLKFASSLGLSQVPP